MPVMALEWSVPLSFLLCGVMCLLAERMGIATARWGWGLLLLGGGYGLMLIRTANFSPIKPLGEDLLLLAGASVLTRNFMARFAIRRSMFFDLAVMALTLGMSALLLRIERSVRLETFYVQLGCILLVIRCMWNVRPFIRTTPDKVLFTTAALLVTVLCVQVGGYLTATNSGNVVGAWSASLWGQSIALAGLFISIVLTLATFLAESLDLAERFRQDAHVDALTKLLNRRGFEDYVNKAGMGTVHRGAMVIADIDHFKAVNDSLGHQAGDGVIATFAALFAENVAGEGRAARMGGEEFMAYLPFASLEQAREVAEAIRMAFGRRAWGMADPSWQCTASFGVIAVHPGETLATAARRADELLYAAKRNGRNQVVADTLPAAPEDAGAGAGAATGGQVLEITRFR